MNEEEFEKQTLDNLITDLKDIDKYTSFKNGAFIYDLGKYQGALLVNHIEQLQQENKQLKSYNKLCIKSSFTTRKLNNLNSILTELEEWLKETRINSAFIDEQTIMEVQLKIQELKEKYK